MSQSYRLTGADIARKLADISFRGQQRFDRFPATDSVDFEVAVEGNPDFLTATIDGTDHGGCFSGS